MPVDDTDVVRVTAEMSLDGVEDVRNVFHVRKVSGGTIATTVFMADVATQLEVMYTFLIPQQRTVYSYDQITGQIVFGGTELMPDTPWPVLTVGGSGVDGLPYQNAALILGQTTVAKTQGRKYLAGFVETSQFDSNLLAVLLTPLANWAVGYIAPWTIGANTYEFGTFNPITLAFTQFVSAVVQGVFRTQRRRTRGFGS